MNPTDEEIGIFLSFQCDENAWAIIEFPNGKRSIFSRALFQRDLKGDEDLIQRIKDKLALKLYTFIELNLTQFGAAQKVTEHNEKTS